MNERNVETVEVAPVQLVGMQAVDGHELTDVEGGFSWGLVTLTSPGSIGYLKQDAVATYK
jgi:hypothetical protein